MKFTPAGPSLGTNVTEIDLAQPLSGTEFALLLRALGEHGVITPEASREILELAA